MTTLFRQENSDSRRRLEELVRRLSPEDLTRPVASGWTVAALLAHIAVWDQRLLVLLKRWQEHGVDLSPLDPDAVNDAVKPLCLALQPQVAARLCLSTAQAVDDALESLSDRMVEQIQASPIDFRFNRALHRDEHLSEIESLLQAIE